MYGRGWTKDEMKVARNLRQTGHTYQEIAKILGRNFRSVKDFLLRNHIYPTKSVKHLTMRRASAAREQRKRDQSWATSPAQGQPKAEKAYEAGPHLFGPGFSRLSP